MKKIKYLIPAVALMFGLASCDNMDELYKDYKVDYSIYSTPVSGQSAIPGKERVILSWKSPIDKVAKGIKITWNEGEDVIVLNELVNEYSVEGLQPGSYAFSIMTTDAYGNESLAKSVTGKAYGEDDVRSIPKPGFSISVAADYTHVLHIKDLSSALGNWGGLLEVSATSPSGEVVTIPGLTQEFNILEKKKPSSGNSAYYSRALDMSIPLQQTLPAGEWTINWKMSTHPASFQIRLAGVIYYTAICADPFTIEGTATVNVAPVEIPEPEEETPAEE